MWHYSPFHPLGLWLTSWKVIHDIMRISMCGFKLSHWWTNTRKRPFFIHQSQKCTQRMITWRPDTGNNCVQYNRRILYQKREKKNSFHRIWFSVWHFRLIYRPAFLSVLTGEGRLICSFLWEPSYQQQTCSNKRTELTIRATENKIHQGLG